MNVYAFLFFLTLHGVNTAMYLAVTRVSTSPESVAPFCYPIGFGSWLVMTVAMSRRGLRSASYFAAELLRERNCDKALVRLTVGEPIAIPRTSVAQLRQAVLEW